MINIEQPNSMSKSEPFGAFRPPNKLDIGLRFLRKAGFARGQFRRFIANWIKRNHKGPWDVEIRKYRARIFLHDNSCELKAYLAGNAYCNEEFRLIAEQLSKKKDPVFIDIGANAGLFTLHAHSVTSTDAKILSIEPNPILVSRLTFNITANNATDKCTVYPFALGASVGEAEFTCTADMGSGALATGASENDTKFTALIMPLKNLLSDENITKIDILKIDIEGFEDRVMHPFFSAAPKSLFPEYIIIENNIEEWEIDCIAEMTSLGYQVIMANKANIALHYQPENQPG